MFTPLATNEILIDELDLLPLPHVKTEMPEILHYGVQVLHRTRSEVLTVIPEYFKVKPFCV